MLNLDVEWVSYAIRLKEHVSNFFTGSFDRSLQVGATEHLELEDYGQSLRGRRCFSPEEQTSRSEKSGHEHEKVWYPWAK